MQRTLRTVAIPLSIFRSFVGRQPFLKIAVACIDSLEPHFPQPWQLTVQPHGSTGSKTFGVLLQAGREETQPTGLIELMFQEDDTVLIPTLFLPREFHHQGAMIGALGRAVTEAEIINYRVIVCNLVPSQLRRLLNRGAREIPNREAVELHGGMNFLSSNV